MKNIFYIIGLMVILSSCKFNETPDYVIPKEKMVDIIVDIHITDGLMTVNNIRNEILENYSDSIYNEIFIHHGYSRSDFDTSVYFYSYTINKYDEIYKEVLNVLSEKEALIKEEGNEKGQVQN